MGRRITGVIVLSGCLLAYDPTGTDLLQRGIIPALMALAAWGLVQNLAAVALGVAVLSGIHSDFTAPHWLDRLAYPAISLAAGVTFGIIVWRRFRHRVLATHEERCRYISCPTFCYGDVPCCDSVRKRSTIEDNSIAGFDIMDILQMR